MRYSCVPAGRVSCVPGKGERKGKRMWDTGAGGRRGGGEEEERRGEEEERRRGGEEEERRRGGGEGEKRGSYMQLRKGETGEKG